MSARFAIPAAADMVDRERPFALDASRGGGRASSLACRIHPLLLAGPKASGIGHHPKIRSVRCPETLAFTIEAAAPAAMEASEAP